MKGKYIVTILSAILFLQVMATASHSCVGRLLVIAVADSPDQMIMAEMVSLLVNERTGTTIEFIKPGNLQACHEAVKEDKAQIYIGYVGEAKANIGDLGNISNPDEIFNMVRQNYLDSYKMVWLKPFGYDGPVANGKTGENSLAAPISTTDVINRFPVLDRVINKLSEKVDNKVMVELMKKTESQDVKEVVKEFLKSQKMI